MLVPSTFTGWYRKIMITSTRPRAMARSRVHVRNSPRNGGNDSGSCGVTEPVCGVSDMLSSNIYNTASRTAPNSVRGGGAELYEGLDAPCANLATLLREQI